MATLRDVLGLGYGAQIITKVNATNLIGNGPDSNITQSGATVETPP